MSANRQGVPIDEETILLLGGGHPEGAPPPNRARKIALGFSLVAVVLAAATLLAVSTSANHRDDDSQSGLDVPLEGLPHGEFTPDCLSAGVDGASPLADVKPEKRGKHIEECFADRHKDVPHEKLVTQHAPQSVDANVFFRATAALFWPDFGDGVWGGISMSERVTAKLTSKASLLGRPLNPYSLWTWVTGDQHLSNFGAWRNRNGEVVFGVNDVDEAAIFDFHIDVIRIAVSLHNHAVTNGFNAEQIKYMQLIFLNTYLDAVFAYVGSDRDLTFEITARTARGKLQEFLERLEDKESKIDVKFTTADKKTGQQVFEKNEMTRLVPIEPELEREIREQFTAEHYGSTMVKIGFAISIWDDDFFTVLDVARRVGSGIGSYGVDRFYVLLKGDGEPIVLDVKFEPVPAAKCAVKNAAQLAWHNVKFPNEAARATEGQRRLTSHTDPCAGWTMAGGNALLVRERSPWKAAPNLDEIADLHDFVQFMEQAAVSTATSHVRGTVSKSPGQFKHMLFAVVFPQEIRMAWTHGMVNLARHYHGQVQLDFACFRDYVEANYASS